MCISVVYVVYKCIYLSLSTHIYIYAMHTTHNKCIMQLSLFGVSCLVFRIKSKWSMWSACWVGSLKHRIKEEEKEKQNQRLALSSLYEFGCVWVYNAVKERGTVIHVHRLYGCMRVCCECMHATKRVCISVSMYLFKFVCVWLFLFCSVLNCTRIERHNFQRLLCEAVRISTFCEHFNILKWCLQAFLFVFESLANVFILVELFFSNNQLCSWYFVQNSVWCVISAIKNFRPISTVISFRYFGGTRQNFVCQIQRIRLWTENNRICCACENFMSQCYYFLQNGNVKFVNCVKEMKLNIF